MSRCNFSGMTCVFWAQCPKLNNPWTVEQSEGERVHPGIHRIFSFKFGNFLLFFLKVCFDPIDWLLVLNLCFFIILEALNVSTDQQVQNLLQWENNSSQSAFNNLCLMYAHKLVCDYYVLKNSENIMDYSKWKWMQSKWIYPLVFSCDGLL